MRARHPAGMLLDDLEVTPVTVAQLDALHRRHREDRNFTRTVAEAVGSGSVVLERAGAWLLRREAAVRGSDFPAEDWAVVIEALPGVRSWAGRLILCQLVSEQPALMDAAPAEMAEFLRGCVAHPKPTVRAWSVNAFHELARRHPEFRAEARRLVAVARRDRTPCVQARLRHLS